MLIHAVSTDAFIREAVALEFCGSAHASLLDFEIVTC
jgi:hypothetical protein